MKFGKQLLLHIIPEWADKYLDYKILKKMLKKVKKKIKSEALSQLSGRRSINQAPSHC